MVTGGGAIHQVEGPLRPPQVGAQPFRSYQGVGAEVGVIDATAERDIGRERTGTKERLEFRVHLLTTLVAGRRERDDAILLVTPDSLDEGRATVIERRGGAGLSPGR